MFIIIFICYVIAIVVAVGIGVLLEILYYKMYNRDMKKTHKIQYLFDQELFDQHISYHGSDFVNRF